MAITRDRVVIVLHDEGFFKKGNRILDIGCGTGAFASQFRHEDIEYYGVDIQRVNIMRASLNFVEDPHFHFFHFDINNDFYNPKGKKNPEEFSFPFPDQSFDGIICKSLFTHLERKSAASQYISEIKRMLKKGGKLWSSWFTDPPNKTTESAYRTVFRYDDLRKLLRGFRSEITKEAKTTSFNDQLEIISVKI